MSLQLLTGRVLQTRLLVGDKHSTAIWVTSGQSNRTQQGESAQPWVLSTTHDSAGKISGHAQGASTTCFSSSIYPQCFGRGPEWHIRRSAAAHAESHSHKSNDLAAASVLHHFPLSAIDSSLLWPHNDEVHLLWSNKTRGRHTWRFWYWITVWWRWLKQHNGKRDETVGVFSHLSRPRPPSFILILSQKKIQ